MNKNTITLFVALLSSALSAQAYIVLNVDFSNAGTTNGVQATDAFQNFNAAIIANAANQSFAPTTTGLSTNNITVGLSVNAAATAAGATLGTRDRAYPLMPSGSGNMAGLYKDVYRDFYRTNKASSYNTNGVAGGAGGLVLTLSGLTPSQEYSFAWQSFDTQSNSNNLGTYNIRGFLITGTTSGATFQDANVTTNMDPSASLSIYGSNSASALFPSVISDESGVLSFRFAVDAINDATQQTAFINAFELAAVPEPSTYALLCGLAVGLATFLHRRK